MKKVNQESRTLDGEQNMDDQDGLLELLTNPKYHLKELRSSKQNEIRLHLQTIAPQKFDFKDLTQDNIGVTISIQQVPVKKYQTLPQEEKRFS